ncbi:MAG: glutaredoxin family protein [Thermoleophilia bacterium]|nr:glutaredoxin family protein [Thermoleophilia bacterium]
MRVFVAGGCHLCDAAEAIVRDVCAAAGASFGIVPIDGDPELERRYRERLPVVEVDGEAAFTFFVSPDGLRRVLARRR